MSSCARSRHNKEKQANVVRPGKCRERERERERGLSRERDVPAALKISHDVQKRLVHVALVAREPQFNRSHVHQRIVGGLRVLLRGGLRGVHLANARPEASSAFRLKI